MTRTAMNLEEREAMHLLDLVAAGMDVPESVVWWAMCVTGDAIGVQR